ncbi:unnamed protein product [Spirodela intermedia]|uniref:Uncharacterized protein n=2 Tax=Spirodela intermedia TaxID=51605 RepID=A0A7I8J214_SPIIN|nr:unnamed protein product [Spirodela intermedia]CAA6664198.1 unnamed protein product [Spirodela intermedia]CAA7400742.1 unnamed protein product [Spirodela intermedia]
MLPWKALLSRGDAGSSPVSSPFPPAAPAAAAAAALEDNHDELVAICDRRTLYLVNIFLGSSANFLNSFAAVCEDKLADVHRRILRVDSTLRILEAKLCSASKNSGHAGRKEDGKSELECHRRPSSLAPKTAPSSPPLHLTDLQDASSSDLQIQETSISTTGRR